VCGKILHAFKRPTCQFSDSVDGTGILVMAFSVSANVVVFAVAPCPAVVGGAVDRCPRPPMSSAARTHTNVVFVCNDVHCVYRYAYMSNMHMTQCGSRACGIGHEKWASGAKDGE
jgi:hypothetical protein